MQLSPLSALRYLAGIESQSELATTLGVKRQTVSAWETGARRPSHNIIPQYAEALGATMADLMSAIARTYGSNDRAVRAESARKRLMNKLAACRMDDSSWGMLGEYGVNVKEVSAAIEYAISLADKVGIDTRPEVNT